MNLLKVFRGIDSMLPIFWMCKINPLCLICQSTLHSQLQPEWMADGKQMLHKAFIEELRWNFWRLQLHWKQLRGKLKCNWLSTVTASEKVYFQHFLSVIHDWKNQADFNPWNSTSVKEGTVWTRQTTPHK